MQPPFEFVSVLSSEQVDFVAVLSAEQGCDVCHELHAAVDELRCATCEAAICPDCARLRPDTRWACARCYERHPGRVFGTHSTPRRRAMRRARFDENASTKLRLELLVVLGMIALRIDVWRDRLPGLSARAIARWQLLRGWLAENGQLAARVAWRATSRFLERARRGLAQARFVLRSLPVRHHATALLMATLLLYTVARAEHRDA